MKRLVISSMSGVTGNKFRLHVPSHMSILLLFLTFLGVAVAGVLIKIEFLRKNTLEKLVLPFSAYLTE